MRVIHVDSPAMLGFLDSAAVSAQMAVGAIAALFGLVVGSFCTVVIWRVPRGVSVVRPASACVNCATAVPIWLNVPVLAWLVLRGRARCCASSISPLYPLVEAAVAVLWMLLAAMLQPVWLLAAVLPFAAGAVCVTVIDAQHHRIPHAITAWLAALALAGSTIVALGAQNPPAGGGVTAFWVPAACGAAASSLLWGLRLAKPSAMGGGDVRFAFSCAAVSAAVAGPGASVIAVFAAVASAALFGVAVLGLRSRGGRSDRRIAFGPHLAFGSLLGGLWGDSLWSAYTSLL